jgi:hypothetical protein
MTPERISNLGLGFWASRTVLSAVDLGVFGALAAGPADLAAMTTKLGLLARHEIRYRDVEQLQRSDAPTIRRRTQEEGDLR